MVRIIQFLIHNFILIKSKIKLWEFKPNLKINLTVNIRNLIEVNHQSVFVIFKTFVLNNFVVTYVCYSYDIIITSCLFNSLINIINS